MKTFNLFSISVLILFIATFKSCTIQKRHYLPGYHVEWKNKNANNYSLEKTNNSIKIATNQDEMNFTLNSTLDEITNKNDDKILALSDNSQFLIKKEKYSLTISNNKTNKNTEKPIINKNVSKLSKSIPIDPDKSNLSIMALVGFITSTVGLLLLLIFGFPFFLGTIGTVFSAIGLSQTSKGKTGKGFAIAGLVIGILTILLAWIIIIAIGIALSSI